MRIGSPILDSMRAHAARSAPDECCGILLGVGDRIDAALPAANVAADRRRHFEIAPQALIDAYRAARAGGPAVVGYYHSHPAGPARPSATDAAMAAQDGMVWAIMGLDGITFWRDGVDGFEPLPYRVASA